MTKVLGVKVSDEVYQRIETLGVKSDVLRAAIDFYLWHHQNIGVNWVYFAKDEKSSKDL